MKKASPEKISHYTITIDMDFLIQLIHVMGDIPALFLAPNNDFDVTVNSALAKIGEHLRVSRVYVMQAGAGGSSLHSTHSWVDHKATQAETVVQDFEEEIHSLKMLLAGKGVDVMHVRDVSPDIRDLMERQGVASVLLAPILRNATWIGLVGLDCGDTEREWSELEMRIARHLADILGMALERREVPVLRQKIASIKAVLADGGQPAAGERDKPVSLRESERRIISETLEMYNGNKLRTAKHLGLTWPALDRRCKKLGIDVKKKA